MSDFGWATVNTTNPLTVRKDGETEPIGVEPDSLINKATLDPGNRVWYQSHNRRVIILGVAGTSQDVMQYGDFSTGGQSGNETTSIVVTFPKQFSEIPNVVVCINSSVPHAFTYPPTVSKRYTTSFTFNFERYDTTSTHLSWQAIGKM